MKISRPLSLHTRISLVLTGLAASLLLVAAGLWLEATRTSIHEEVEAATRVSEQWLKALAGEMRDVSTTALPDRLLGMVRPLGRVRANALELFAADGSALYHSPPPTYKAGRVVPDAFANLLAPTFAPRTVAVGELRLVLTPDASRAIIDAWDDLLAMGGWALCLLGLLFFATRHALDRALHPLVQVMAALDRTGQGRFDTRLPAFATPELGRLSRAFNGMADRLAEAVNDNVRLDTEREVAEQMQARLEAERRLIARELHDELAQGITAVRALAGAIVQRSAEMPTVCETAQGIVGVTSDMQDGVRRILHRLRPVDVVDPQAALQQWLAGWRRQHAAIALNCVIDADCAGLSGETGQATLRIVQEGLTNVVRHAQASRVDLTISRADGGLRIILADNGRGIGTTTQAGCGLGLRGMGERVAALGGHLNIENPAGGGFALLAELPVAMKEAV